MLKPMPRPTSRMTEVMPQMIPNMVRKLRSLVSQSADIVCLRISSRGMGLAGCDCGVIRRGQDKGSVRYACGMVDAPNAGAPVGETGRYSGLNIRRPQQVMGVQNPS